MSFDVNVLSSKPVIKAAANMQNDGGGGNLGYMGRRRKKGEKHSESINIFAEKSGLDTFTVSGKLAVPEEEAFDIVKWIAEIISKIMSLWK